MSVGARAGDRGEPLPPRMTIGRSQLLAQSGAILRDDDEITLHWRRSFDMTTEEKRPAHPPAGEGGCACPPMAARANDDAHRAAPPRLDRRAPNERLPLAPDRTRVRRGDPPGELAAPGGDRHPWEIVRPCKPDPRMAVGQATAGVDDEQVGRSGGTALGFSEGARGSSPARLRTQGEWGTVRRECRWWEGGCGVSPARVSGSGAARGYVATSPRAHHSIV